MELRAQLAGIRVVQLVEDGQGPLPALAGGLVVAGGLLRLAEVAQQVGLVVPGAEVTEDVQRLPVVRDRLVMLAEVMVGETDAVQRLGLAVAMADVAENAKRPSASSRTRWP